jgi:hypothetical protein
MPSPLHDEPSKISVEDGHVVIRCPEGQTFTFTPDAAVITSDRLFRAGLVAKRQEESGRESPDEAGGGLS